MRLHRLRRLKPSGFALVATISMMVLLLVVAVGLLTLSSLALSTSSMGKAEQQARANARMALMVAISRLQTEMGPDNRISARGSSMANHPELKATVSPQSPQSWWVGVASSDPTELIGPNQQPVSWLVSGLDESSSAAQQLSNGGDFKREVIMYGDNSIDLTLTGGSPIVAGLVPIKDAAGFDTGSYAYLVDDNGMKAQLAPTSPDLVNDNTGRSRAGSSIIPGAYNIGVLDGMDTFDGVAPETLRKLNSVNDLPLIGGDRIISNQKRLSYTTRSLGVLSDVKHGGLKKDLTIAFEPYRTRRAGNGYNNQPVYDVFDKVFAKKSSSDWGDYLIVDESKRSEFGRNGYIHWAMLRDYYNIKRQIQSSGRYHYLDPIVFSKDGVGNSYGLVAPHDMGPGNGSMPATHQNMPYGDYDLIPPSIGNNRNTDREHVAYYKHSPIMPVIAQMQVNAWLEKVPIAAGATNPPPSATEALQTNVQLWVSHYNPYNIVMRCQDYPSDSSVRMQHRPQVHFRLPTSVSVQPSIPGTIESQPASTLNLRGLIHNDGYHVDEKLFLEPGIGQVCAFERNAETGEERDGEVYGIRVKNLTLESIYNDHYITGPSPGAIDWYVDIHDEGLISHGLNNWAGYSYELSQLVFAPLAREKVKGRSWQDKAGVRMQMDTSTYNTNSMARFSMLLRSTMESDNSIRPLIDSNIRGFYFNPRWDYGLDLETNAAYTWRDNKTNTLEQIPEMKTRSDRTGNSYWGAGHDSFSGFDRVILFDIPREDLLSLGQLQHANCGRFSYEPSYIIGNSYANPRIPLDEWKANIRDTYSTDTRGLANAKIPGSFPIYDASYLVNEVLWDSYIFTTIPQMDDDYGTRRPRRARGSTYTALLNGSNPMPNPRFIPYEPAGSFFNVTTLQDEGDEESGSFFHNAGHLLVDGAFNVNSTSVDAWEAFLSGTYGMPYQRVDRNGRVTGFIMPTDKRVRFPRVQSVYGGPMDSNSPDENYWIGFRALEQEEVRELAEAIVDEINQRGPFLTFGDFVNRKLDNGELGEKGALQAALDKTINDETMGNHHMAATNAAIPTDSNQGSGFPGQLLQGDILQALSPMMTVRSDTFTIRAYGETLAPDGKTVLARAWCEATVQRYPDPVDPDPDETFLSELVDPSSPYGRQFEVTSFRWLNANEV